MNFIGIFLLLSLLFSLLFRATKNKFKIFKFISMLYFNIIFLSLIISPITIFGFKILDDYHKFKSMNNELRHPLTLAVKNNIPYLAGRK